MSKTPDLNLIEAKIDGIYVVLNALTEAIGAQNGTLDEHTLRLDRILSAVEREPAADGDPFGDLIRRLVENGEAHTQGLQRIEQRIAALTDALRAARV